MKKRILSLALAICMLMSAVPVSHAGILSAGNADIAPVEPVADEILSSDGILSSGDESPFQWESLPEQELSQGILSSGEDEQLESESSHGILSSGNDEEIVEEPEFGAEEEPGPGLLVVQCGECGYLDNNHAKDCSVIAPVKPVITVPVVTDEERKPAIVYSNTYFDTYAELMTAETLEDFESTLDSLSDDQQEELFDLLSDDEQDALDELEDTLTRQAIAEEPQKVATRAPVTVESRSVALSAARRAALQQLGYELIVNVFGKIVETVEMLQSTYTTLETVTPTEDADYQWQILADDAWVDILDQTEPQIRVSYAMVASLLDRHDAVSLRCEIMDGDDVSYTDPVEVCVELGSDDVIIDAETEEEPVQEETEEADGEPLALFTMPEAFEEESEDAPFMLLADEGEPELQDLEIYDVTIRYVFEDGTPAADPYTSSFTAGYHLTGTVPHRQVQGYKAGHTNELPDNVTFDENGITFSIEKLYQDINIVVTMVPAMVKYTVLHYKQNINNDDYYLAATDHREALTGTLVGEVARVVKDADDDWEIRIPSDIDDTVENWYGFYPYQYEKPIVAADGSTVIEVYYDRFYYLMTFELGEGAYGTEPIYARYEAALGSIPEPTRAGYTFMGWSLNGTDIVSVPSTMPAEKRKYTAIWEADDTAKVTIVFWGENANDEEYSYINSATTSAAPGTSFTYTENMQLLICGQENHTHGATCKRNLTCGKTEHSHSSDCCSKPTGHTHTTSCYSGASGNTQRPNAAPSNAADGQIYTEWWGYGDSYIYISGNWYRYNGNLNSGDTAQPNNSCTAHTHGDSNCECSLTEHTHTDACYTYSCGLTSHTHVATCYQAGSGLDADLWNFVKSDTVTVKADGTTVVNVYYDRQTFTFTFRNSRDNQTLHEFSAKWGAYIQDKWTFTGSDGNQYPQSNTSWTPKDSDIYDGRITMLVVMPQEDIRFTHTTSSNEAHTFHYYVESLDQTSPSNDKRKQFEGIWYDWEFDLYNDFNSLYYDLDFFEIEGYTRYKSALPNGTEYPISSGSAPIDDLHFYYKRTRVVVEFYNPSELIKSQHNVLFGDLLQNYYFEPSPEQAPDIYEPNSVAFAGWCLNPECDGDVVDISTLTIPAPPNNKDGEVALTLYAKWVGVNRSVKFYLDQYAYEKRQELENYPEEIVPHGSKLTVKKPTNGNFIFVGWFYMDNGVEKAYDFANMHIRQDLEVYGKWSSKIMMNYIVYYKTQDDADTPVAHPVALELSGSAIAGSTKTFIAKGGTELFAAYQDGYFPTVTSHSIVIETSEDKNEWYTVNAETKEREQGYTFRYVQRDAVPYLVRYVDENGGELHAEKLVSKNRKAIVTENFVPVTNYMPDAYQKQLVVTGAQDADTEWITKVDENGKEIQIHPDNVMTFVYKRDEAHAYYREIHYIQSTDGTSWLEYAAAEKIGEIGKPYTIKPLNIVGFTYDESVPGTVTSGTLSAEGMELKLYYKRNLYPYEVRYLEQNTGKQLATPKSGDGLYQQQIPASAIPIDGYVAVAPIDQTVYIRIESGDKPQLNVITFYYVVAQTSLTINKTWRGAECYGQDAIFTVSGGDLSGLQVVIPYKQGGNSVTITGLKVGTEYTVAEDGGWSWRFTVEDAKTIQLKAAGNALDFTNTLNNDKIYWFDGNDWKRNRFGDPEETNE